MKRVKDIAIAESSDSDFKERLETKNAKSWLKSVSAFANGIGGTLYFGVEDQTHRIIGLDGSANDHRKNHGADRGAHHPAPVLRVYTDRT